MARKTSSSTLQSKLAEALDASHQASTTPEPAATSPMSATINIEPAPSLKLSADQIVKGSVLLAAGAGAVPVAVWDAALISGVQLKMLADLSSLYGIPFSENMGKGVIGALIGGVAPSLLCNSTVGSTLKLIPGIGTLVGIVAQPVFAGVVTYALGQVFIKHFESGGTLLTFKATEFKETFTSEVKAGFSKVKEMKI